MQDQCQGVLFGALGGLETCGLPRCARLLQSRTILVGVLPIFTDSLA